MKALIIKIIFAENSEFSCCKSVGFKRQKTKTQSFDLFNIELNELFNIKTQALFESFRSHQEVEMSKVRLMRKKNKLKKKFDELKFKNDHEKRFLEKTSTSHFYTDPPVQHISSTHLLEPPQGCVELRGALN